MRTRLSMPGIGNLSAKAVPLLILERVRCAGAGLWGWGKRETCPGVNWRRGSKAATP
jgi:hypothetical protein